MSDDRREAFEEWCVRHNLPTVREYWPRCAIFPDPCPIPIGERSKNDEDYYYEDERTFKAWQAWQAASTSAPLPESVDALCADLQNVPLAHSDFMEPSDAKTIARAVLTRQRAEREAIARKAAEHVLSRGRGFDYGMAQAETVKRLDAAVSAAMSEGEEGEDHAE